MKEESCANCKKKKTENNESEFTAFKPTEVNETVDLCGTCIVEISGGVDLMQSLDPSTAGEISIQLVSEWVKKKDREI